MINVSEYRIGNLIDFYGNIHEIEGISKRLRPDCGYFELSEIEMSQKGIHIKPIPITEEWLLKFGFQKDKNHGLVYDHPSPLIPENEHKDLGTNYPSFFFNKRLNRWMDCHTRVCVDYVHSLQNLYFALTGEELCLKK